MAITFFCLVSRQETSYLVLRYTYMSATVLLLNLLLFQLIIRLFLCCFLFFAAKRLIQVIFLLTEFCISSSC